MAGKLGEDTEKALRNPKDNEVLNHFATWCDSAKNPERRMHFLDASVQFSGETEVDTEDCSLSTRCYAGLRYKLFPDVADAEWGERRKSLEQFLNTTFFGNMGAQALWLASERLAAEGIVSKRMLIVIGAGGSG